MSSVSYNANNKQERPVGFLLNAIPNLGGSLIIIFSH